MVSDEVAERASADVPYLSLGKLQSGESVTVTFHDEGGTQNTEYGDASVFDVTVDDAPEGMLEMGDEDTVEAGEKYVLLTSSGRFIKRLVEWAENYDGEITGRAAEITARGEPDVSRRYDVTDA